MHAPHPRVHVHVGLHIGQVALSIEGQVLGRADPDRAVAAALHMLLDHGCNRAALRMSSPPVSS